MYLLLISVMCPHHHVAVWRHGQRSCFGPVPTHSDFSPAQRSSAWVVLLEVAQKGLPASSNSHHHVTLVQHTNVQNFFSDAITPFWLLLNWKPNRTSAGRVSYNALNNLIEKGVGVGARTPSFRRPVGCARSC